MTVARVGAAKNTLSTTTNISPAFNQAPTAGNLLVMAVVSYYNTTYPTHSTPTGWTAGPTGTTSVYFNQSYYMKVSLFWKVATGSDATPSITINYAAYSSALVEEWSGLSATPHDVDSTVGTNNTGGTGSGNCNSGPLTTTNANDWIWSFIGADISNQTARTLTWGGGSTVDALVAPTSPTNLELGTATQLVSSTGTYTPTLAFATGTNNWLMSATASMAFKIGNVAPNAPTLNTPATSTIINLAVTNRFGFTPSDPDAGDTQTAFDLRYQVVGAGSWTTVSGTTNPYYDFAGGTFTANDYDWKVRTYDSGGLVGPYSATNRFTAANAPANPTITVPTSGSAITSSSATVTWTATTQTDYQIRRVGDTAGSPDTGTIYYDSGDVVDGTTRSLSVSFPTNTRWEHIQIRIKASGLWSTWADCRVQVSWAIPGDVTAVPAIARALAPTGITTGVGASIDAVPAIARALTTAPDVLSADIVDAVAGAARALAPISNPGAAYTIDAVPGIASAYTGSLIRITDKITVFVDLAGIAHTGAIPPTITAYPPIVVPVYTLAQYRARFLDPQVNITRRVEILEADGSTLWDDKFGNKKRLISGAVSVDYTRDERRSCDLELANFDGALVHKPDGFWYDKVLRLFRGIEFYDESGLRSYEVTLGTFMIDRVTQARFPKTVKITARDFTKKCMLSKFTQATGFTAGTAIETVIAAMASNADVHDRIFPVTGKVLGVDTFFERDTSRWDAMKQIAEAFGYELFFNAQNFLVMRLFIDPTLGAISHEFKTGPSTGNLVDWEKSTNDTRIFNHVSITGTDANSLPVWAEALNNNPSSPTNIARIGDRTYSQESAFVTTTAQAQALADSYLRINGLEEYDVSLSSVPAPWLEAGEIVRFLDPDAPPTDPDRFLMTSLTIPMDLSPMSAVGRRVTIVS